MKKTRGTDTNVRTETVDRRETSEKNATPLCRLFIMHPELNASAIARRLRMSQSLFAQYISGTKKPSAERERMILDEIKAIGWELITV